MSANDPKYRGKAVAMRIPKSSALAQCALRWTRSNRRIRTVGVVLTRVWDWDTAPLTAADVGRACRTVAQPVDWITVLFPEARLHLVDQTDRREPFERLVTEHRSNVEPHRSTVCRGYRSTEHSIGDDDVR